MNRMAISAMAAALICSPGFCGEAFALQQQAPGQTPPSQKQQDVPHQKPGTNNPDVGNQRQPSPDRSTTDTQADVPHQKPSTENPDVGKQRHPKPKKTKRTKSTSTSSTQL